MRKIYVFLLLVVIFGGFLRFYNLEDRGILLTDAAYNFLEARSIDKGFNELSYKVSSINRDNIKSSNLLESPKVYKFSKRDDFLQGQPTQAKALHIIFIWISALYFGFKPYASLFISALFGILSIPLIYLIGKEFYNQKVGIFSAVLLTVSGYHILYSRSGEPDIGSLFFFMLAILFYYWSRTRIDWPRVFLILTGLFAGFSYTYEERWVVIPIIFLAFEIQNIIVNKNFSKGFERVCLLLLSMACPLILIESIYYIIFLIARRLGYLIPVETYFEQLLRIFFFQNVGAPKSFDLYGIIAYPYYLFRLEGIFVTLLIIIGLIAVLKRKKRLNDYIILSQFLIIVLFYSLHVGDFPRLFTLAIPSALILASQIFYDYDIIHKLQSKCNIKKVFIILICIVLLLGTINSLKVLRIKAGYNDAIEYIQSKDEINHLSTQNWISAIYVGVDNVRNVPKYKEDLYDYINIGYNYLIVDYQLKENPDQASAIYVQEFCEPEEIILQEFSNFPWPYYENIGFEEDNFLKVIRDYNPESEKIYIYNIKQCLLEDES